MSKIRIIAGLALLFFLPLEASDAKSGLWHAVGSRTDTTVFFMVYDGVKTRIYNADWKRVTASRLKIEGDDLRFQIPQGHIRLRFEGGFKDGAFQGSYVRPHPQFRWEADWKARRISSDPAWEPWAFLKQSQGGMVNLLQDVVAAGPFASKKAFLKAWRTRIEPKYFPVLTHSIYTDDIGALRDSVRADYEDRAYKILKSRWNELKKFSADLTDLHQQVAADLKKLYPWLQVPGHLVANLSLDSYDYRSLIVNKRASRPRLLMLLGTDWMVGNLSDGQRRYLMAHALLTQAHVPRHRPPPFIRTQFIQRGMSSLLASKLDYSEDPADYLFQEVKKDSQRRADFKKFQRELEERYRQKAWQATAPLFLSEHRGSSYLLAFDFARMLSRRYSSQEMLERFQYDRLNDEMTSYLASFKKIPSLSDGKDSVSEKTR